MRRFRRLPKMARNCMDCDRRWTGRYSYCRSCRGKIRKSRRKLKRK